MARKKEKKLEDLAEEFAGDRDIFDAEDEEDELDEEMTEELDGLLDEDEDEDEYEDGEEEDEEEEEDLPPSRSRGKGKQSRSGRGSRRSDRGSRQGAGKSQTATMLFSLALGFLGLDRFYCGHFLLGGLKLLATVGCGVMLALGGSVVPVPMPVAWALAFLFGALAISLWAADIVLTGMGRMRDSDGRLLSGNTPDDANLTSTFYRGRAFLRSFFGGMLGLDRFYAKSIAFGCIKLAVFLAACGLFLASGPRWQGFSDFPIAHKFSLQSSATGIPSHTLTLLSWPTEKEIETYASETKAYETALETGNIPATAKAASAPTEAAEEETGEAEEEEGTEKKEDQALSPIPENEKQTITVPVHPQQRDTMLARQKEVMKYRMWLGRGGADSAPLSAFLKNFDQLPIAAATPSLLYIAGIVALASLVLWILDMWVIGAGLIKAGKGMRPRVDGLVTTVYCQNCGEVMIIDLLQEDLKGLLCSDPDCGHHCQPPNGLMLRELRDTRDDRLAHTAVAGGLLAAAALSMAGAFYTWIPNAAGILAEGTGQAATYLLVGSVVLAAAGLWQTAMAEQKQLIIQF